MARDLGAQMAIDDLAGVRALSFDVFGTVVDYRATIIAEGDALNLSNGLAVDWGAFADAWRAQYRPNMQRVARGELPWMNLDALHRLALDELLPQFGMATLSEAEKQRLNRVWHRLRPWPDAVAGLTRLRANYTLATLSNGNVALLVDMARHAGLPWDCVLSAELAQAYKPDPRVYQMAWRLLGLRPDEVMLVAAHPDDLRAARGQGLRTCFVPRPREAGPHATPATIAEPAVDLVAPDFIELARLLGVYRRETDRPEQAPGGLAICLAAGRYSQRGASEQAQRTRSFVCPRGLRGSDTWRHSGLR